MSMTIKQANYCVSIDREQTVCMAKEQYREDGVFYLFKTRGVGSSNTYYVKGSDFNSNAVQKYSIKNETWVEVYKE